MGGPGFHADGTRVNVRHGYCSGQNHGGQAPPYRSWLDMKARCDRPTTVRWERYGGRGIGYDIAWSVWENFWAEMGPTWSPGMTLERLDVDGNYCKSNCTWTPKRRQSDNKSSTVWLETKQFGRIKLIDAAAKTGLRRKIIYDRVHRYGWPHDEALGPLRRIGRRKVSPMSEPGGAI
jgi:hypothetical protein